MCSTISTSSSTRGCSRCLPSRRRWPPICGLVSVLMHSSLHLERIGDQAVNVAKIHLVTRDLPSSGTIVQQIGEMGDIVVGMVQIAMDAFRRRDIEQCLRLPALDDPVDRLNRNMHLEVAKLADDPRALDWGMRMNLAARALERVGDNAVDIGEQVSFLMTGEFREFTDASHEDAVPSHDDGGPGPDPGHRGRGVARRLRPIQPRARGVRGRRSPPTDAVRSSASATMPPTLRDPRPHAARDVGASTSAGRSARPRTCRSSS